MLTATAIFQNGQRFTQAFARESERIIWIVELRLFCKNKGIPCPEIIEGSPAMRKLTSQDIGTLIGTSINGNYICNARIKHGDYTDSDHYGIILAKSKSGRYVTWQFHLNEYENPDVYWGHYFGEDHRAAVNDFHRRDINPAPTLSAEYWDCECDEKYIHENSVEQCFLCGAYREDMPDSRQEEVDEGIHFA